MNHSWWLQAGTREEWRATVAAQQGRLRGSAGEAMVGGIQASRVGGKGEWQR